jgi:hypothetical protein
VTTINNAMLQILLKMDLFKAVDLGGAPLPFNIMRGTAFTAGVAAGSIDTVFVDTRTIAASGSEDLDLSGALPDPYGLASTAIFAKIRAIMIYAKPANVNNVLVGGVANGLASFLSPAASGILTLRPGASFALACGPADTAGYAVTAATADLLHVANSGAGTGVDYDIAILGTSS